MADACICAASLVDASAAKLMGACHLLREGVGGWVANKISKSGAVRGWRCVKVLVSQAGKVMASEVWQSQTAAQVSKIRQGNMLPAS